MWSQSVPHSFADNFYDNETDKMGTTRLGEDINVSIGSVVLSVQSYSEATVTLSAR